MDGTGRHEFAGSRAALEGSGLEVATAINSYLSKAKGDMRLALALSVADGLAATRLAAAPPRMDAAFGQSRR